MAKNIVLNPVGGVIRYKGNDYAPGDTFSCDEREEALRLIDAGVAVRFVAEKPVAKPVISPADEVKAKLLASIAAAQTIAEATALLPAEEPDDEIKAAFAARFAELNQLDGDEQ